MVPHNQADPHTQISNTGLVNYHRHFFPLTPQHPRQYFYASFDLLSFHSPLSLICPPSPPLFTSSSLPIFTSNLTFLLPRRETTTSLHSPFTFTNPQSFLLFSTAPASPESVQRAPVLPAEATPGRLQIVVAQVFMALHHSCLRLRDTLPRRHHHLLRQ